MGRHTVALATAFLWLDVLTPECPVLAEVDSVQFSMTTVYGLNRYEPRPPEDEIDADLFELMLWVAEIAQSLDPGDIAKVELFARQ